MKNSLIYILCVCICAISFCACSQSERGNGSSLAESESSSADANSDSSDKAAMTDISIDFSEPESFSEPETSIPPKYGESSRKSIVVLGDSIARGYGLKNIEKERFSSLLAESLKADYGKVSVQNYGVDGMTGRELAELLKERRIKELSKCDTVIISIGGNNILQHITDGETLSGMITDFDPVALIDYFRYLKTENPEEKSKLSYAVDAVDVLIDSIIAAFEGEAFAKLIETAGDDLRKEIPEIIGEIRKVNKTADIYIQTVYNPFKGVVVELEDITETPIDLGIYGENAVSALNTPILELADEYGYTAVEVHSLFEEYETGLTNAVFDLLTLNLSFDPHPNLSGHLLIADLYYKIMSEDNDD